MAPTPRPPDDLASFVDTLLQPLAPASRVAGVGGERGGIRDAVQGSRAEVTWFEDAGAAAGPGAFEAVLWCVDTASPEAGGTAVKVRRLLTDGGLLIAVVAGTSGTPPAREQRGSLPAEEHRLPRRIIRGLSEAGFAIRGERFFPGTDRATVVVFAAEDAFRIRSYIDGDETAILDLFPTCFHVERGLDHWRWKYLDNPYGNPMISMAFSPAGELASHYASYPTPFWIGDAGGGRTLLALQMGDTMTDPRFRDVGRGNSGLLPRTVRHFFAIHRNGRFGFFYGFNTGPIQRFCVRFIGGSKIAPVGYWTRDLEPGEEPLWTPGQYRVERIRRAGKAWDRFFERAAPHYGFLVRRDARWVEWRYLRCPDADYVVLAASRWGRLAGWGVFRRRGDHLIWGDALIHPRHAGCAAALLAAAVRTPELADARRLEAWFPPRPEWWSERLPGLGLTAGPQPEGLGMVALEDGEEDALARLRKLYYTMGDGDLF
ncbi:MAG: hypothetical protein V3T72_12435 [Thermoanaerobaculia bacterium]